MVCMCSRENARFMAERIPEDVRRNDSRVKRAILVLNQVVNRDYIKVWDSLVDDDWENIPSEMMDWVQHSLRQHILEVIICAFSSIEIKYCCSLLRMFEEEAVRLLKSQGAHKQDSHIVIPDCVRSSRRKSMTEKDIQALQTILITIST